MALEPMNSEPPYTEKLEDISSIRKSMCSGALLEGKAGLRGCELISCYNEVV